MIWVIKWKGTWKRNGIDKAAGVLTINCETRDEAEHQAERKITKEYSINYLSSGTFDQTKKGIVSDERFALIDLD